MTKRDAVDTQISQRAGGHQGIDGCRSLTFNVEEVGTRQRLRRCVLQQPRPITPPGIASAVRGGPPLFGHIDFSVWHRLRCGLACQPCEPKQVPGNLACGMTIREKRRK